MYICKKCGQANDDNERFCVNCGDYIGEPLREKPAFDMKYIKEGKESKENNVQIVERKIREKSFTRKVADNFFMYAHKLFGFYKNPDVFIEMNIKFKNLAGIIISIAIINSLLLLIIHKYVLTSYVAGRLGITYFDLTNIEVLIHGFVIYMGGFVLLFCSTYLITYYIFKKDISLLSLIKVQVMSSLWIILGLLLLIILPIFKLYFLYIILLVAIVQYFVVFIQGIVTLSQLKVHNAGYAASLSHIVLFFGIYIYIAAFIK